MGMFDYKTYSSQEAAALVDLTHQLAVYANVTNVMGLPSREALQWTADTVLNSGFYASTVNFELPTGWREVTPAELGLSASALDSSGFYKIASPLTGTLETGPQAKILGQYDATGQLTSIAISFAGTNSPVDVLDYFQLNEGTIAPEMEALLKAVKDYVLAQGLSGEDVLVTGYSLGGGMTNVMARFKETLADGFFSDSTYIGHAAPVIYDSPDMLNMGYENDVVYRIVGDEATALDAIAAGKPGLVNPDSNFGSTVDNIVLFNDVYASPIWEASLFSILNIPTGWYGHIDGLMTDATARIAQSAFYDYTARDSTVIVDNLSALTRGTTWVSDKAAPTSSHYGTPAFIIGNQYDNLLQGGRGGDYIDAGAGNDKIKTGEGADRITGGTGTDTLILDGTRSDWNIYRASDGDLFFSARDGSGIKQVSEVEKVSFSGDLLSLSTPYTITSGGLVDQRYKLLQFLNYDIEYNAATQGSTGNDQVSGKTVFALGGNDTLLAVNGGSLLHGGEGDDRLMGGAGNDTLYGAEGNDLLRAGGGTNQVYGGVGDDLFAVDAVAGQTTIHDFLAYAGDEDVLSLSRHLFADMEAVRSSMTQADTDVHISQGLVQVTLQNSTIDQVLQHTILV